MGIHYALYLSTEPNLPPAHRYLHMQLAVSLFLFPGKTPPQAKQFMRKHGDILALA